MLFTVFVVEQVWNTAAAEPFVRRFLGHSDHIQRCAFADTRGEAVLSCGSDGTVREREGGGGRGWGENRSAMFWLLHLSRFLSRLR